MSIIDQVEKIVRETCAKETNQFTYALDTHFISVVKTGIFFYLNPLMILIFHKIPLETKCQFLLV